MLPISFDISPIVDEFIILSNRSEEFSSYVIDRMTEDFMNSWENMVNSELGSTRQAYKRAMNVEKVSYNESLISLLPTESKLPMMIEDGASSFDMQEGFSKSSKAVRYSSIKDKKEHWYLTIPFRHATSEAVAESMVFANKMPKPIEKIAKENKGEQITMAQLPQEYQKLLKNKTTGVQHKSPIYEGIKRIQASSSDKENRGNYISFRRVSDNSEDGAFVHPGFKAKRFMDRAGDKLVQNMSTILDQSTNDFILGL